MFSKRAHYFGALMAVAVVAGAIAWTVAGTPETQRREPVQTSVAASIFAETLKAAETGDSAAEYKLSRMYAQGVGVDPNRKEALNWLERAAKDGDVEAQYEFGNALREGAGVVQDYQSSVKWLQLAAERGNADAQYALGQMYRAGLGVEVDNAKAYTWFNLAAAHDLPGASVQRDAIMRSLTPSQIVEAQAEARRLNDAATATKQSSMEH